MTTYAKRKLKYSRNENFNLLHYVEWDRIVTLTGRTIRECYAVVNAFTIRNMYSLLLYMKCNSRKINRPTKNMTKIVTLLHF